METTESAELRWRRRERRDLEVDEDREMIRG
jgi:hypothetical protein